MVIRLKTVSSTEKPELPGLPTAPHSEFADTQLGDSARAETIASAFKAISHPVRIRILDLLSRQSSPMCVCHIEARFTLSQPTISHHLRLLREAGLVDSERRGTWIYYAVRREGVEPLNSFVKSIICDSGVENHAIPI